jgi:hypothetical protein
MTSIIDKLIKSALGAGIMVAVSHPQTYSLVENIVSKQGVISVNGCPTATGHLVHTAVFMVLIYALMLVTSYNTPDIFRKPLLVLLKYAFFSALIFFVLSSAEIYKFVNKFTGGVTADFNGCPTNYGILLHAFIYFIVVFVMMLFPADC